MNRHGRSTNAGRHGVNNAVLASVSLLAAGAVLVGFGVDRPAPPPQPPTPPVAAAAVPSTAVPSPTTSVTALTPATARPRPVVAHFLPASQPTRLEIRSINLRSTTFVPLQVDRSAHFG